MQKEKLKIENHEEPKFLTGEARFVFEKGEPAGGTETPAKAPEKQKPAEALAQMKSGIQETIQREAKATTGENLDYKALSGNPDQIVDTIAKFLESWHDTWDRLCAVFAPLGVKPSEIEAIAREPGSAHQDTDERPSEEWEKGKGKIEFKDWKNAEHASLALAKNPSWMDHIRGSSQKYGIPESTIVAIIEMESSFDPNARPIDKKTGRTKSSAVGFAQVVERTLAEYERMAGIRDADPTDPKTAIDIVAWYCDQLIKEVDWHISERGAKEGFKQEYALTKSDTRNLHLAYHHGALGYLLMRRYMDSPTPENRSQLADFQKKIVKGEKGKEMLAGEAHYEYATRVEQVAEAYEAMNTGAERFVRFDSPPVPMQFCRVTSAYGVRTHPKRKTEDFHEGTDYAAPQGTAVLAVMPGTVTVAEKAGKGTAGNFITLRHPDGSSSIYMHLSAVNVAVGQTVSGGTEIGKVGSTGLSTGPHLHFTFKDPAGRPRNAQTAVQESTIKRLA